MGEIIDFMTRRTLGAAQPMTMVALEERATDLLLIDWEKMARNNRLNDYFRASLPNLIDQSSKINFMGDLNEVAALELNNELFPIIYFPGTLNKKQHGWIVMFHVGDYLAKTPELASEAYARCFAVLLHIKLKRAALEANLIV